MEVFSGAIMIAEEWIVDPKANVEVVSDTRSAHRGDGSYSTASTIVEADRRFKECSLRSLVLTRLQLNLGVELNRFAVVSSGRPRCGCPVFVRDHGL